MRTLQEKYNAILEGNFPKAQFVRDARLQLPNFITQFNGFEDTVSILKNKGMIFEAKKEEVPQYDKPAAGFSIETLQRGIDAELQGLGIDPSVETPSEEQYEKAKTKAEKNLEKDPNHYLHLLSGDSKKVDKHDKYVEVKKNNHVDTFNGMKKAELKEGVVEKAMSKGYTREQVEEALARLKEKKGKDHDGDGDIDSDDYIAAKDKAIKGVIQDRNQNTSEAIGGPDHQKLEDLGYSAGEKALMSIDGEIFKHPNFDSFVSGFMKGFQDNMEASQDYAAHYVNEGRRKKTQGGKIVTENDYETGGYVESMGPMFDKAVSGLVAAFTEWKEGPMTEPEMIPFAKKDVVDYIDNQLEQSLLEEKEEVVNEQSFDDLEAAKEYARKESEAGYVQHVNKHPKGGFRVEDWLDGSDTVISYQGGEVLQENTKQNKKLKEAFKSIISKILTEEVITEAATGNLSKLASDYEDFEGMQASVNALENIVTDIESYYSKTRDKIQGIFDQFTNIKNPDGINVGPFLGPSIEAAFMKDLAPVKEKGFTKGLGLPKVRMIKPGDLAEEELDEKETVFTPVTEGRKYKYTNLQK